MASVTGGGKSRLRMIRVGGGVVVLHVTGAASGPGQVIIPVHVALRARQIGVRSG